MKSSTTSARLVGYFEKHKDRAQTFKTIGDHFSEVKLANLQYHLKSLCDKGFLIRLKPGVYQKNPEFQSLEAKRASLTQHLRSNGSPVVSGEPWKAGDETVKLIPSPVAISIMANMLGESILGRMKTSGLFTEVDLKFFTKLLAEKYPLSEQQRLVADR